ncbi:MAG: radical SAM protein [Candidatus Lokiarchaeota archaeon]|nr:radical SAM protein [Candidatus Lokiarchaeota archaeon]
MLVKVTRETRIPLHGLDFVGVIDRGTNLVEVRPTTLCNLRCAYCYANAGGQENDFIVDAPYLIEAFERVVRFKGLDDIEAHVDPYGEGLLYKDLPGLIKGLRGVPGVRRASMQSNGTMLGGGRIGELRAAGLDQINVTLNTMDPGQARKISCRDDYNLDAVLRAIEAVPGSGMDLVIAPVWFFGVNDAEIGRIVEFYKGLKEVHPEPGRVRVGIQNYLAYRTGRKLGKVKEREFGHFYSQLRALEKKHGTKLVLSARDFGIHPAPAYPSDLVAAIYQAKLKKRAVEVEVVAPGRNGRESIGTALGWGVKVLNFSGAAVDPARRPRLAIPAARFDVTQDFLVTATLR